jgi:hypothetical protein
MMGRGKPVISATNVSIVIIDWSSGKVTHLEARAKEQGFVAPIQTLRRVKGATPGEVE